LDWDEREQIFKMSGKIVRTANITQSAVGNKDGLWTTVFAAAAFINDDAVPNENSKSAATSSKGPLQEEVLRQTLEGQLNKIQPDEQRAQIRREIVKSEIEQGRSIPQAKKSLS
jgi:hypothetical protein